MKTNKVVLGALMLVALISCGDDDDNNNKKTVAIGSTLTIDATDYSAWTYINLKTGQTQKVADFNSWNYLSEGEVTKTEAPKANASDVTIEWHIAIHRFDIKTNGGAAVATTAKDFASVTEWPIDGYQKDVQVKNKLITDMSGMMKGEIGYAAASDYNEVLSAWLTKTPTGSMPPYTYDPTNIVYIVKNADGSYAKLLFTDYSNDEGTTGHVTFSYEYQE